MSEPKEKEPRFVDIRCSGCNRRGRVLSREGWVRWTCPQCVKEGK